VDGDLVNPPKAFAGTRVALQELLHPADRPRVDDALAAHLDHAATYDEEYRVRKADGSWAWWRETGAVQRDEQGKPFSKASLPSSIPAKLTEAWAEITFLTIRQRHLHAEA